MVNVNKLKGKIIEKGMNVDKLANHIGIDKTTLYRKLNNDGCSISIKEANLIAIALELNSKEAIAIFFNNSVAYEQQNKLLY